MHKKKRERDRETHISKNFEDQIKQNIVEKNIELAKTNRQTQWNMFDKMGLWAAMLLWRRRVVLEAPTSSFMFQKFFLYCSVCISWLQTRQIKKRYIRDFVWLPYLPFHFLSSITQICIGRPDGKHWVTPFSGQPNGGKNQSPYHFLSSIFHPPPFHLNQTHP